MRWHSCNCIAWQKISCSRSLRHLRAVVFWLFWFGVGFFSLHLDHLLIYFVLLKPVLKKKKKIWSTHFLWWLLFSCCSNSKTLALMNALTKHSTLFQPFSPSHSAFHPTLTLILVALYGYPMLKLPAQSTESVPFSKWVALVRHCQKIHKDPSLFYVLFIIILPNTDMDYRVHFFRLLIPDPVCPVPINSLTSSTFLLDHLSLVVFPCWTLPSLLRQNNFLLLRMSHQISFSLLCLCNLKATLLMPGLPLAV